MKEIQKYALTLIILKEIPRHLKKNKNILIYKAKQFMMIKKSKKSLYNIEDSASFV